VLRIPRKLHGWLRKHSLKLLAITDTPNAIAGGVTIGILFGFSPLFGLKTLLSLLFAWLFGCNLLAAAIAVTLHDLAFLFMPLFYRWEYDVGFWFLHHEWPPRFHWLPGFRRVHFDMHWMGNWRTLFTVGKPLLIGWAALGAPVALATFFTARGLIARHRRKHPKPAETPLDASSPKS
jgi:uncharacterized protein (DUF2062 family)